MKKMLLFMLGLILLPAYPFLKRWAGHSEKMQIGERVVVVTYTGQKKRTIQ